MTIEAKTRESMTACTTTSAERNMFQTDRLWGSACGGTAGSSPVFALSACCARAGSAPSETAMATAKAAPPRLQVGLARPGRCNGIP